MEYSFTFSTNVLTSSHFGKSYSSYAYEYFCILCLAMFKYCVLQSAISGQGYVYAGHGYKESKGGGSLWLWPIRHGWCLNAKLPWECTDFSSSVAVLQGSVFRDSDQEYQVFLVVCEMCFKPERRVYTKYLCCPFEGGPGWRKVSTCIHVYSD